MVDRAKTDPRVVLGVVMEAEDGFYRIGTGAGILSQKYSRNQINPSSSQNIFLETFRTKKYRCALQSELIRSVVDKDISIAIVCKDVKLESANASLSVASATVDATIAPVAKTNNYCTNCYFCKK